MNNLIQDIKRKWYKIYFVLAMALCIFSYGIVVGAYQYFPFAIIQNAKSAAEDWAKNFKHYTEIKPEKFLRAAKHTGSDVTINLPDKAYNGVTIITSFWDDTNGIILIEMDGTVIHKWHMSLNEIFPDASHHIGDWDVDIHGTLLYPNGDIVFNFEYNGLVKINKYSDVIWKLPHKTHHSIFEDSEGNLWVPGSEILYSPTKRLPLLEPPILEEFILKISPDGKILKEISILDIFYNSGQEALLFANGVWSATRNASDIMHVNDIDILEESIAEYFPLFDAGDIMVSIRNLNLIILIDSTTERIKWFQTGPYLRQHDPDFLDNGHISVYDNRFDNTQNASILGGSRILNIDPVSGKFDITYEGNEPNDFYSSVRGEHHNLPNGNILINESEAGRVFEITPSGQIVWSYINRYDEDEVVIIADAIRYPLYYKNFIEEINPK